MHDYLANRLVQITESLTQCGFIALTCDAEELSDKHRGQLKRHLVRADIELKFLGLEMTRVSVQRLAAKADTISSSDLAEEIDLIRGRFSDEIDSIRMIYVTPDKICRYNKTDLFGEEFKASFPTANAEISEAGNCFAFDRYTASSFHLMRGLEVVLKSLFQTLGLPPLTTAGERNWNGILRQIKDKLDADKTIPDHEFYENAYAFLVAAKNPMRNATMHVDAVYEEASATRLFDAIGAFMRHIATKLKE